MVKVQTVRSLNKLVASMSSLMHWFAATAGSIIEKNKNGYYVFELRRTCLNYWWIKVLPAYCHFKI